MMKLATIVRSNHLFAHITRLSNWFRRLYASVILVREVKKNCEIGVHLENISSAFVCEYLSVWKAITKLKMKKIYI